MATNNFTTRTASLRATKIDTSKIILKGKNILDYITESKTKVLDDRGDFVTNKDLWGTSVTTDKNGVVHVSRKYLSNPNGGRPWNQKVKVIFDNKAYSEVTTDADGYLTGVVEDSVIANIQTDMIRNGMCMFDSCPLMSFNGDLSSLTDGSNMFNNTKQTDFMSDLRNLTSAECMFCNNPLSTFSSNLGNLKVGAGMFRFTALTKWKGKKIDYVYEPGLGGGGLGNLIYGSEMFMDTPLTVFEDDLSNLETARNMFMNTKLTSFEGDLSSLVIANGMFGFTALTSFTSDLNSLVNGKQMFWNTHKRGYTISYYKMVNGVKTKVTEHFRADGLTSFSGDLGSLQSGYGMFGDVRDVTYTNEEGVTETTKDITPLDEQSVMIIADTIKDLNGFTDWDSSIDTSQRGVIHIGYDSTVCDAANIEEYCTEIMNKGWTVYLNGTLQTTDDGIEGIATLAEDGSITVTPVPYYCKPVEVGQKEANWTDGEKYYIILGAQKVFGDDLSNYGMFTSIENAAMNMGFTPYEYVEEEEEAQA